MKDVRVGIIGANGYVGVELVRLLLQHPSVQSIHIYSRSQIKQELASIYPNFYQITNIKFVDEQEVIDVSDIIFTALPHGTSEMFVSKCVNQKKRCIDLGADFRLYNEQDYQDWYDTSFQLKDLHKQSVYGLSEIYEEAIKHASIIGNPGCYPTAIALGLYPILKNHLNDDTHIIIDAKSGITGAGRVANETTHFASVNEGFHPYKVAMHRHTPEIIQTLSDFYKDPIQITFVPHLLPVNRGILATMYVKMKPIDLNVLHTLYQEIYKEHPFVRVLPLTQTSNIKYVQKSNYCDISLHYDTITNTCIIVSAIDNMVKGAAGQAIQNMNIILGLPQVYGLEAIPSAF